MLEDLLAQDPDIQRLCAESYAEGYARGYARSYAKAYARSYAEVDAQDYARDYAIGELKGLRRSVVIIVKARFPALTELAQQRVMQIDKPDLLDFLVEKIAIIPDEATVRLLLD